MDRLRCERHTVIRANRERQSVLTECALEDWLRRQRLSRKQSLAGQQKPCVPVSDGQWIAVHTIAGTELSFEVRGPQIIGCGGADRDHSRVQMCVPTTALPHEPTPCEQVGGSARRWPVLDLRMSATQYLQQLSCTSVRMRPAELAEQIREPRTDLVWAGMWCTTAIRESLLALLRISSEPHVADATADTVAGTELGHREPVAQGIVDELNSLFHR